MRLALDLVMASASTATTCCCHFGESTDIKVTPFSHRTFERCSQFADRWVKFDCPQAEVARNFFKVAPDFDEAQRIEGGYHRHCYQRFTLVNRIQQLERNATDTDSIAKTVTTSEDSPSRVKKLRSADPTSQTVKSNQQSQHVLPALCIFCKTEKTIVDKATKKRNKEDLRNCELIENEKLLRAARAKGHVELLRQVEGKDLVAIELRYHPSCFRNYMNDARILLQDESRSARGYAWHSSKAYSVFKERVIFKKLVKNGKPLRMTRLVDLLKETAREIDNRDISVNTHKLKCKLKVDFPQLLFLRPPSKRQSEVVLYEGAVADFVIPETEDDIPLDTDSSDEELSCSSDSEMQSHDSNLKAMHHDTRALFHVSMQLKHHVEEAGKKSTTKDVWPPEAKDMSLDIAEDLVPNQLFNALAWIVGAAGDYVQDGFVPVQNSDKRKLLSICQDILNLAHRGRMYLPKHYALGMTIRHISGSSALIQMINGFGHCMGPSTVLEHDTGLAQQQISRKSDIPEGFIKKKFTCLVWDNNDFGEETLSGKDTTHNTNGIIIQRLGDVEQSDVSEHVESCNQKLNRDRKRTLKYVKETIPEYHSHKKERPPPFEMTEGQIDFKSRDPHLWTHDLDLAMALCKLKTTDVNLPGWTGFNIRLQEQVPQKSKVGYLPVVNGSPTQMKTVNSVFQKSLAIADEVEQESIVLVFDLAFYKLAQQVRWHNAEYMDRTVVRLGEFHTCLSFLGLVGKRFQDSGLSDIIIEAEVIAKGSLQGVMKGRHYNRSIRTLKIVSEALRRLQVEDFLHSLPDNERDEIFKLCKKLREMFPQKLFVDTVHSTEFQTFVRKFCLHVQKKCEKLPTYAFWHSYLEMADLLLTFVRATREGDWKLHLSTLANMVPWFFSYDHLNYAKYLPVYLCEMACLDKTHPSVATSLPGNFAVQQQDSHSFSQTAMDQTIEQTCNRDTKTKGGLTGFTQNAAAVHRWIITYSKRAEITLKCREMAGVSNQDSRPDSQSRADTDEQHVMSVMDAITSTQNPFTYCVEELVNIVTGQVASDNVKDDMMTAYQKGCEVAQSFLEERLTKRTTDFHESVKQMNLKTFKAAKASSSRAKDTKELKAGKELMTRLLLVAKDRKLDLRELLSHDLTVHPPSLCNSDGAMSRTTKAALLHHFEKQVADIHVEHPQPDGVLIIDAMALIQELADLVPSTFGETSLFILRHIVKLAAFYKVSRIDFVCDRYNACSIKDAERNRRTGGMQQCLKRPLGPNQKTPQQFRKFLMSGQNKESLCCFLVSHWQTLDGEELRGRSLYETVGGGCCMLSRDSVNAIQAEDVADLACDHEEADTRLLLHARHASSLFPSVVIKSPDTDVFLLCIANASQLSCPLYFSTGSGNNSRLLYVNPVSDMLGQIASQAIVGMHAFTGCDSTSSLKGKGKIKPLQLMLQFPHFAEVFSQVGHQWQVSPELLQRLEEFVCRLYGQNTASVNEARHNLFRLTCKADHTLPPTSDSLSLHCQRANYQAAIWRCCMTTTISAPPPVGHGWRFDPDKNYPALEAEWIKGSPAYSSVVELVKCGCKKKACRNNKCSCKLAELPCTDLCQCVNCENRSHDTDDSIAEDSSSAESEEELDEDLEY